MTRLHNTEPAVPRGGKYLLVASTGGHLAQLRLIATIISASETSHWVTFDTPQSRSLLADQPKTLIPYIGPRDFRAVIASVPAFVRMIREQPWDAVISTGAAIAFPALFVARVLGTRAVYIESVSRVKGPSLTGRLLSFVPGIQRFTQHSRWASHRWFYDISVFDAFTGASIRRTQAPLPQLPIHGTLNIFVTLGTIRPYRFDALVSAVLEALKGVDYSITWQLGITTGRSLPGQAFTELGTEEFDKLTQEAGVVITHAGVATCLKLVQQNIFAIVVPRRALRNEHVDDHQAQIASELAGRGLCDHVEVDELSIKSIMDAYLQNSARRRH